MNPLACPFMTILQSWRSMLNEDLDQCLLEVLSEDYGEKMMTYGLYGPTQVLKRIMRRPYGDPVEVLLKKSLH